ncbi:MAG: hypothetical protein K2I79_04850, partial [Clostridia bacterium]|nr:hypothetical protein [Clostridia bacterium]
VAEELTALQADEENLMLGLRTSYGCDLSSFNDKAYAKAVKRAALNNAEYFDIRGDVICAKGKYMSVLSQLTLLLMSDKK